MNASNKISAVVITKNEERIIEKCIDALWQVADEIIIVDSGSNDRTQEICVAKKVKFYHKDWEGFSANKNFGIDQAEFNWILSIDADEILEEELIKSINNIKFEDQSIYVLKYITNYCGHWVKHCGWYPRWIPRLFNKNMARWDGKQVHEQLKHSIPLNEVRLKGLVKHYSYYSVEQHTQKIESYARYRAKDWITSDKPPSYFRRHFGPTTRFLRGYVFLLGFLDGKTGFTISKQEALMVRKQIEYYDLLKSPAGRGL